MTGREGDGVRGGRGDGESERTVDHAHPVPPSRRLRVSFSPRLALVLAITLVALLLRLRAAFMLPLDADEPTYMAVARQYAADIQAGNLWGVITFDQTLEHPALVKLLYAVQLVIFHPSDSDIALRLLRMLSVAFGTAQVFILALLNPLAGLALAVHTMTIKYTSQVYLEAAPGFFAIAALLAFERYRYAPQRVRGTQGELSDTSVTSESSALKMPWFWLILSALCLGATAAGKYPYLVAGLAIAPFLPWKERNWRAIGAFIALALATFFVLDVSLWADPLGRLAQSLLFHPVFSQSTQVTRYGFPWWKPLDYLLHPVPWHPGVFYLGWDGWVFALGMLGLPLLWRRSRPYVVWALVGLAVVLLWPTKWPQYTIIVIPPLCLSLGYGVADVVSWADDYFQLRFYLAPFSAPRSTLVLAVAVGLLVAGVLFGDAFTHWQENLGWQQVSMRNSGLVSDFVQTLAEDSSGNVWVGTHDGLTVFDGKTWTLYTETSGALPSDNVKTLAIASGGTVWVGTEHGVAALSGAGWRQFRSGGTSGDIEGDDVRRLAIAPDGGVWAATTRGLGVFDGRAWTWYRAEQAGLPSDLVFTVAVAPDGRIWAGTDHGAAVLDTRTQTWQRYDRSNSGLEWDAVSAIAVASDGRVWLGTLGGGLAIFDGQKWATLSTTNSDLPWNTIIAVAASPAGDVWVAADLPAQAGGNVARFDGAAWKTFVPTRSGIAAGSASCFAFNDKGRVAIGMRAAGISFYTPPAK